MKVLVDAVKRGIESAGATPEVLRVPETLPKEGTSHVTVAPRPAAPARRLQTTEEHAKRMRGVLDNEWEGDQVATWGGNPGNGARATRATRGARPRHTCSSTRPAPLCPQ